MMILEIIATYRKINQKEKKKQNLSFLFLRVHEKPETDCISRNLNAGKNKTLGRIF